MFNPDSYRILIKKQQKNIAKKRNRFKIGLNGFFNLFTRYGKPKSKCI